MKASYCPNCGVQNVQPGDSRPNGGELYVADDGGDCTEYYDEANPYDCPDCGTRFYMSGVSE